MPTTYSLVPIPLWYFSQTNGLPLGAGSMGTYLANTLGTVPKPIFSDSGGLNPYANPVNFNANGEAPGPFFWANDNLYDIYIWDGPNGTGNQIKTILNYGPAVAGGGGGGGGTINNFVLASNYITNNIFWRNFTIPAANGSVAYTTVVNGTVLAPSNHEGFRIPDITYIQTGAVSAVDQIQFPVSTGDFSLGACPLTGDVTPETYIDWKATAAGDGATAKAVQFPVDLHVKNLEQQIMTAMIWAKGISGTQNLTMNFVQDFGTQVSGPPSQVLTSIAINASPLTNSWKLYLATFTVPSVAAATLSPAGDDASYIQVGLPTGQVSRILFTKPKLYLGQITSVVPELPNYDSIDSIISSPRTGDIRTSLNSFQPFGWLLMNDGSIGCAGSGATRAAQDTWPLYNLIWNNVNIAYAPMVDGLARGASALADFNTAGTGRAMYVTKALGRALASIGQANGTGTTWALGQSSGNETETLSSTQLPDPITTKATTRNFLLGPGFGGISSEFGPGGSGRITNDGGNQPHNLIQPTTFLNIFIKL